MSYRNSFEFNHATFRVIEPDDAHAVGTVTGTAFARQGHGDLTVLTDFGAFGPSATATVRVQHADRKADGSAPDPGDYATATDRDGNDIEVAYADTVDDDTLRSFRVVGDRLKEYVRILLVVGTQTVGAAVVALSEIKYSPEQDDWSATYKIFE